MKFENGSGHVVFSDGSTAAPSTLFTPSIATSTQHSIQVRAPTDSPFKSLEDSFRKQVGSFKSMFHSINSRNITEAEALQIIEANDFWREGDFTDNPAGPVRYDERLKAALSALPFGAIGGASETTLQTKKKTATKS